MAEDEKALSSIQTLQKAMRHNSSFNGMINEKAPDVSNMIKSGGMDGEGRYANLGNQAFKPGHITTDEDYAKLSSASIERAGLDGWLTPEQATSILDSDVQAVKSRLDQAKIEALEHVAGRRYTFKEKDNNGNVVKTTYSNDGNGNWISNNGRERLNSQEILGKLNNQKQERRQRTSITTSSP